MIKLQATKSNIELGTPSIVIREGSTVDLSNYYTKTEVDSLIPDTSGFALKSEIPDVSKFITEIPAEYVTETELNAKGYLTEHQSLDGYAKTTDIPDVSGFALKTEIPDVSSFITTIPEEYVTETELAAKGYLTEHQSLEGYAKIADIPDVSGFQTEAQVNTLINNALGVIENGTY